MAQISSEDLVAGAGALKIDDDTTTQSHVTALGDFVGPAPSGQHSCRLV